MKTYAAIVHKDSDSAYGIVIPDLPGCYSAGDTFDELMSNVDEAIDLYFEDTDFIEPRPIDDVREELQSELDKGAFFVAIPYFPETTRKVRVNVTLNERLIGKIDAAAAKHNQSRSAFLEQAARDYLRDITLGKVA